MVIYGSLLAASSKTLSDAIAADPIGALTTLLPKWYLIPFALVAILGLIGGSILDLYSSGITLVSIGLPVKRHIAAGIDGGIMTIGTIYIVWIANNFIGPFQNFLITLGVPVAVWSAMFVADVISRKSYNEAALFDKSGEYGSWNFKSLALMAIGSIVGWSFVSKSIGNIGIIYSLLIGFVGQLILAKKKPRK
jgi:purine-cytosine permease-like protein